MPKIIKVSCPNCGGDEFNECSDVPTEVIIEGWVEREGSVRPKIYGSTTSFFEAEVLEDKPYKCTDCAQQFTAIELIIEEQ